jgi:hypothetical protein
MNGSEVFYIKANTKVGDERLYSIDQLGAPCWINDTTDAMEFNSHGEAESYIIENIIETPFTQHGEDGSLTIKLPSVMNMDINLMSVEVQRVVTTIDTLESEAINTVKASFREVMEVLDSAIAPFKEILG